MTAKFERTKSYDLPKHDLLLLAESALISCGFKIKNIDRGQGIIDAKSRLNIWSWTEEIVIEVHESGSIYMESRCYIPTQVVDWGKNRKNVERFFDALN
jgi:hypothetical protein